MGVRGTVVALSCALALLACVGAGALLRLLDAEREATRVEAHVVARGRQAHALEAVLSAHARAAHLHLLTDDAADAARRDRYAVEALQALAALRADVLDDDEARRTEAAAASVQRYLQEVDRARTDGAFPIEAIERSSRALESALAVVDRSRRANARRDEALATASRARLASIERATIAAASTLVVGLFGTALFVVLQLVRPLVALRRAAARLGGDFRAIGDVGGPRELRDVARALQERHDALTAQRRVQATTLASIAHDLRNPLAAIALNLERIAREDATPSERVRSIALVDRQVERMATLLDDLVEGARVEAGELELECAPADARALLSDVASLHAGATTRHLVSVDVPPAPVVLHVDAGRIAQVLHNLVSNAVKYAPAGGRVRASLRVEDGAAVFEVADQGIGIAPEDLDRIFEPYRRSTRAKETAAGVGLGLSVAKRIVEAHGGTISVRSAVGRGTTFRVVLPTAASSPLQRGGDDAMRA